MDTLEKKHNEALISVIIPVYNAEKYLERCLDSVINQTYTNLEIVVVDDGSTDSSGAICDRYAKKDPRIKVYHKTNGGLASARNYGLDRVCGDYLYYVDSDDWINLELFERCIEKINSSKEPIDLIFFDIEFIFKDKNRIMDFDIASYSDIGYNGQYNEYIMSLFVRQGILPAVFSRFYRFDYIKDVRFFEGNNYEDVEYSFLCFSKTKRYVYIENFIGYYYNKTNQHSITYIIKDDILDLLENVCRLYDSLNESKIKKYAGSLAINMHRSVCTDYSNISKKASVEIPRYTRKIARMRHLPEEYKSKVKRILMYLFPMRMFYCIKKRFYRAKKGK